MVTVAELQALRQARLDLLTGKRVVSVQKDGRRIEYTAASLDELNRAINDAELVCLWQAGDHHAENPQSAGRLSV